MLDGRIPFRKRLHGQISSVTRVEDPTRSTVLAGAGESLLITDVDESEFERLMLTHRVDATKNAVVSM